MRTRSAGMTDIGMTSISEPVPRSPTKRARLQLQAIRQRTIPRSPTLQFERHFCGIPSKICDHCGAQLFEAESNYCCSNRKVRLQIMEVPTPVELKNILLSSSVSMARHFRKHSIRYNGCFSFGIFHADTISSPNGRGPHMYQVKGAVGRYVTNNLVPRPGATPRHAQVYIVDNADEIRGELFPGAKREIIAILGNMLNRINRFARFFREEVRPSLTLNLTMLDDEHDRNFILPSSTELFAVVPFANGYRAYGKQIVFKEHCVDDNGQYIRKTKTIDQHDPRADGLIFPLMLPACETGFTRGLSLEEGTETTARHKMTPLQYFRFRLFDRAFELNLGGHMVLMGRVYHQYILNGYCLVEYERLNYHENLKPQGVRRQRVQTGEPDCSGEGTQKVVLSSSFYGGPASYTKRYRDAMAVVQHVGKPTFFVTMTANPRWREFREFLSHGMSAFDRPALVSRVFKLKVDKLISLLTKDRVLGVHKAYIYSIEFQKRGLPHIHLLLVCKKGTIVSAADIDKYVSAEIPDEHEDPELYETVTQQMMHTCSETHCSKKGSCRFGFRKEFAEETSMGDNTYPTYRRRNNGRTFTNPKTGRTFDNRDVSPYNPTLSKILNCHINVQCTFGLTTVKYLYKYVNKGDDQIRVSLDGNQVQEYISGRYLSVSYATWRLLGYKLCDNSVTVVALPTHVPDGQPIYDTPGTDRVVTQYDLDNTTSMLLEFFKVCSIPHSMASTMLYRDIPKKYVWNQKIKMWTRRKGKTIAIGRVHNVGVRQGELYHVNLLLACTPGPTSFEDLRTFNGTVYETFFDACKARSLLTSDTPFHEYLKEIFEIETNERFVLRTMCEVIHFNEFLDGQSILEDFEKEIKESVQNLFRPRIIPSELFRGVMLLTLDKYFRECGSSLKCYGLDEQISTEAKLFIEDDQFDPNFYGACQPERLNEAQELFFNSVTRGEHRLYYLDGPGGTGKTFVISNILAWFHSRHKKVAVTATTGVASLAYNGGSTVHKLLGLPIDPNPTSTLNLSEGTAEAKLVCELDLLVIDEISMLDKLYLEAIDRGLRQLRHSTETFGGLRIILCGDFRQLLPVIEKAKPAVIIGACCKQSYLWGEFVRFQLTQNMRAGVSERQWADYLLRLGNGTLQTVQGKVDVTEYCTPCPSLEEMIKIFYPKDEVLGAILCSTNVTADDVNKMVLDSLPASAECRTYEAINRVHEDFEHLNVSQEEQRAVKTNNFPNQTIELKVGAVVMILRNISEDKKNGTRLKITFLGEHCVKGRIIGEGRFKDREVVVFPITLYTEKTRQHYLMARTQLPIRLAFAMTIHKSQCQSIPKVGIFLDPVRNETLFTHGHLYVALSRVIGSPVNVFVFKKLMRNVVYREVLI